jgi:hypothetical protein
VSDATTPPDRDTTGEDVESAIPPPPDVSPSDGGARLHPHPPRPGDLTIGWRAVMAGIWIGVVLGLAAVWNVSVQLGLSTWWLGARAEPQPPIVRFSPFIAPVLVLLATINQVRYLAWIGLGASFVVAAVGVGDIGRVNSLAVIELAIAAAAAIGSIATLTGTYRPAVPEPGDTVVDGVADAVTGSPIS